MPRRLHTHPLHDLTHGDASLPRLGPQQAEAKPKGADAAPRAHHVALLDFFERDDARAVVAHDAVDRAVPEGVPERLAVGGAADGRAAFELGAAGGDVGGGEGEVVEAGLDGQRETRGFGGADEGEGEGGGEVDDV